jgi:hypothetical protein
MDKYKYHNPLIFIEGKYMYHSPVAFIQGRQVPQTRAFHTGQVQGP